MSILAMSVLETIRSPEDLEKLGPDGLTRLAREIREVLVETVCATGGHLGPNLGVVELTIALHRVFDSPRTPIVFDTGHQSYVHKLLTGRLDGFASLRQAGGLSGYPRRAESQHDLVENSHASTALAYADGLSRAIAARGGCEPVVAVIGDGAMTGGLAWEGLNNLGTSGRRVVVVLNDNDRSYAPTIGGLPQHLSRLTDRAGYAGIVAGLGGHAAPADQAAARPTRLPTRPTAACGVSLFQAMGFAYIGPVDGHDLLALERAFAQARGHDRPVVVHVRTEKGHGYLPAVLDEADHLHAVGAIDASTGAPSKPPARTWTDVFGDALVELAERRPEVIAVSAAMVGPTGLRALAARHPQRCVDVGIAEQQALVSASGMAMGGLHPVVALYSTFMHRAFDQTLMDVGLHGLPVTLVLDRAGITGPDGPSHHGLWDLTLLGAVPGMRVAAPRDAATLVEELDEAVAHPGPTALRFPKAAAAGALPALARVAGMDVLRRPPDPHVLLLPVGALAGAAVQAADRLLADGIRCSVVDPRWVLPVNPALPDLAAEHDLVVTIEDGLRTSGVGARVARVLADAEVDATVRVLGVPTQYVAQGSRAAILHDFGLDADGVADTVASALAGAVGVGGIRHRGARDRRVRRPA
ncbi:MAG: 1-deoxy-D-xylulose-5-phosphate synthase [Intrasporangium sp.]|uniref:1-deoxy-D-xylulose-5-phosphate synthase n=1 Tax=Intrasporangium sp. TaxID=1925024 RepID=UPI00264895BB|nr:1-deoxy-D-xylulose-5-phosphate synthase [Intrasporangium sp.]MDN5797429.1 1-deoxy-D-xylulose-5-phosphate synthase [Intrasporangium sp.]